jgi:glycosyltransferase involved in cell wall biosynthesis
MGYDVHIYTMHWWSEATKIHVEHGVTLHALCRHYDMYHNGRRDIKEGIVFGLACLKLLRVRFDVLDVDHMPFFPIISTWIVCVLRGRKFYGTWHEALSLQDWRSYMGNSGAVAALIERISIRLPHTITAASQQTKELLASIHGRVERVGLVTSGIDTDLMNSVSPIKTRCDVLYVGRLVKDKNVDVLIRAVDSVVKRDSQARCIIIGKGIEKTRLQRLTSRLGLQQNITFIEPVTEAADIYAYMKAAKVFCSPSSREGFGIVTLEALGCGTPVITTDNPTNAARHLIQNGQNGSIVSLSPDALAKAILYWMKKRQKSDIALQVADHSWDRLAQKQAEVYML